MTTSLLITAADMLAEDDFDWIDSDLGFEAHDLSGGDLPDLLADVADPLPPAPDAEPPQTLELLGDAWSATAPGYADTAA
jgi:hypothetical protein